MTCWLRALAEEELRIYGSPFALLFLGGIAVDEGELDRAEALLQEALIGTRELLQRSVVAVFAFDSGASMRAARLFGAAEAVSSDYGNELDAVEQARYARSLAAARAALDAEAFASAWAEGQAMTPDQAVAYALSEDGA